MTNGKPSFEPFWKKEKCDKLSKKLWMPSLKLDYDPEQENKFYCNHPDISFDYYFDEDARIHPSLHFLDVPILDITDKQIKLCDKLYKKEITRYCKEVKKPNRKLSHEQLIDKHAMMYEKIETKVDRMDQVMRSRRIRLLPTAKQQVILDIWFDATNAIYNELIAKFNHFHEKYRHKCDNQFEVAKSLKKNNDFPLNLYQLRNMKMDYFAKKYHKYDLPYCVITDIIKEFLANVKGNITKIFKKTISDFVMKKRQQFKSHYSLPLESHYTSAKGPYPSILGEMKTNEPGFQWSNVQHDYRLIYDRYRGTYSVHIPKYFDKKPIVKERKPIASMDPGLCVFQMVYGLDHVIAIGDNMRPVFKKRLMKIDELKAKLDQPCRQKNTKTGKVKKVRKKRLKAAVERHHRKMLNIQKELHHKTCNYLCENYERIMVTNFSAKQVSTKKGNLTPMDKRVLQKLSHYRFRQRLQQKCEEYGCQYLEVAEDFTSKTCGKCGELNDNLKGSRTFKCPHCDTVINRDMNGARNIFLKNHKEVLK